MTFVSRLQKLSFRADITLQNDRCEHFKEISKDLQNLLNFGTKTKSITSDGDKSLIKAIKKTYPKVPFVIQTKFSATKKPQFN